MFGLGTREEGQTEEAIGPIFQGEQKAIGAVGFVTQLRTRRAKENYQK